VRYRKNAANAKLRQGDSPALRALQQRLGERIRSLRSKLKYSQEGFADFSGIHRSHMGEIERGESNLTLSTVLNMAAHLKISVSDLFKDVG